jgi:hypothetical protein
MEPCGNRFEGADVADELEIRGVIVANAILMVSS